MQRAKGSVLVRWIGLAMALPALAAVALLTKDAVLVIRNVNADALKREEAALERGLKTLGEVNASELISQTLWDEAFRNVVLSKRPDWIKEHFGANALTDKATQKFIIVEPDGKVAFSSDVEGPPPPESVADILAAAKLPMERARDLYREARESQEGFEGRMPGAMTEGIYVNDVVRIGDRSAMVTVSPFAPDDENMETPQDPTLLIGLQFVGEALLDKLETLSNVDEIEQVNADHEKVTGGHAHAIRDASGNTVAHVTWKSEPPGDAILRAALPAIAVSILIIAALTLTVAATMRRLTRKLADSEQEAVYVSRHDSATGLANRGWFMRSFGELLSATRTGGGAYAVLLIDCDYFKTVNDTLGHAAGDAVLKNLAERVRGLGERIAIAARLGGDEFVLISAPLNAPAGVPAFVEAVEAALAQPVRFGEHLIPVSVSIGAAVFDAPGQDIDDLLARADKALYRAKRDGRGCARVYEAALDDDEMPEFPLLRNIASDRGQTASDAEKPAHAA
jgi:diguanylate cyclase (GGDEF)-like protein